MYVTNARHLRSRHRCSRRSRWGRWSNTGPSTSGWSCGSPSHKGSYPTPTGWRTLHLPAPRHTYIHTYITYIHTYIIIWYIHIYIHTYILKAPSMYTYLQYLNHNTHIHTYYQSGSVVSRGQDPTSVNLTRHIKILSVLTIIFVVESHLSILDLGIHIVAILMILKHSHCYQA